MFWSNQDAFGHVNNTVPIRWFESSRIVYWERSGIETLFGTGRIDPILATVRCNYRRQLHYPDPVYVGGRVVRVGRSSMEMEHVIYSERLDEVAVDGSSVVVTFDYAKNEVKRVPDNVRAAIELIEGRLL